MPRPKGPGQQDGYRICIECDEQFWIFKGQHRKRYCSPTCYFAAVRRRKRLRDFGLSSAAYDELWEMQKGCCAICGVREDRKDRHLAVDHDHACCPDSGSCGKCVRGLLCSNCNLGLGNFADDVAMLKKAIGYLETRRVRSNLDCLVEDAWGTAWVEAA